MDVGSDALAVHTVEEELQGTRYFDISAGLDAPAEERSIVTRRFVVQIHIAENGRCPEMALLVPAPIHLHINRKIGYALRNRSERIAVGAAYVR